MKYDIKELTIQKIHKMMSVGDITCEELTRAYIDRIEKLDKTEHNINSIILVNPNAIEEAKKIDERIKSEGITGALDGIPVLLKDNVDTKDMQTTAGSLSLKGYVPDEDSFITKRILDAGALILAKVNLHEFAIWGETISSMLGQTHNPYDLTRTPGGSSGGTGAAVASNFGMIGIGTDTINSVRSPSSANNLAGIRPTIGLVSRSGIIPYSYTQDTAGPICRTIEDCAVLLDVIAGYDKNDSETVWSASSNPKLYIDSLVKDGLKGKRVGVLKSFFGKEAMHEDVTNAVNSRISQMKDGGAILVDIDDEIDSEHLVKNVSVHLHDLKDHLDTYLSKIDDASFARSTSEVLESGRHHKGIKENLETAMSLSTDSYEYFKRLAEREKEKTKLLKLFIDYDLDAIVYPHQKQLVCEVGGSQKERNGVLASVTGFPSICVQAGFSRVTDSAPIGVPVGMEILGKPFTEEILIEIAYSLEQLESKRVSPPFAK